MDKPTNKAIAIKRNTNHSEAQRTIACWPHGTRRGQSRRAQVPVGECRGLAKAYLSILR